MSKTRLTIIPCLLAVLLVLSSAGQAASRDSRERSVSKGDAARIVKERYGGRVLDVRPRSNDDDSDYRVKLLNKGRVKVLGVDGRTGQIRD